MNRFWFAIGLFVGFSLFYLFVSRASKPTPPEKTFVLPVDFTPQDEKIA